jgi:uncharacterized protein YkwD
MKLLILLLLLLQGNKPEFRVPDLEQKIHEAINEKRMSNDREPLAFDEELSKLARSHSEDMAARGYFKHVNPEGLTPMKRAEAAGYKVCQLMAENIYQNNLYSRVITEKKKTIYDWNTMDKIANTTIKGWMESEGHRQNILDKNYTREGIGVAVASDDKVYITQMFCGAEPEPQSTQSR